MRKHKLSDTQKKQLRQNKIKRIKFASRINDMQDHPASGFSLRALTHKRHWYQNLWSTYKGTSITKKTVMFGAVFLVALYTGCSFYEKGVDRAVNPPMTRADIKANNRAAKRTRAEDKAYEEHKKEDKLHKKSHVKVHKLAKKHLHTHKKPKFNLKVTLTPSEVNRFEQMKKNHPYRAWFLKTLDVYQKRMQTARSIIQGFKVKEGYYHREVLRYQNLANEYSNQGNKNLASRYNSLAKKYQTKKNYWHNKAKFYWRYRHEIRRIFHRRIHWNYHLEDELSNPNWQFQNNNHYSTGSSNYRHSSNSTNDTKNSEPINRLTDNNN